MCDAQPGVHQHVDPQRIQADVREAVQVLNWVSVESYQQGAPLLKKSTQRSQRARWNLPRGWRERVKTCLVRAAAVNWSHIVPGRDLEELTFPRLSSWVVKVDRSTVSPLHLSWLTCRPAHRHDHA